MVTLLPHEERPWGSFNVLAVADDYQVKELRVKPGARLSYQSHEHREELWLPIKGSGYAVVDDVQVPLLPGLNLPIMIHARQKHRIVNDGETDLVIVEIWTGDELREDDIIRFEDDHGRV